MLLNCFYHPRKPCCNNAPRHSEVKPHKSLGITDEEVIASFEEDTGFISKEIRNIIDIASVRIHINPSKVRRFRDMELAFRQMSLQEVLQVRKISI